MKKMMRKLTNKAICAAFVVLGAMSVCAAGTREDLKDDNDNVVGYKVTGLGNDQNETAVVFTKTGTTISWTAPATLKDVQFLVVGGGGGAGGCCGDSAGAGGGGGAVITGIVEFTKNDKISVTVGKGGTGGVKDTTSPFPQGGSPAQTNAEATYFKVNGTECVKALGGGGDQGRENIGGNGGSNAGNRGRVTTIQEFDLSKRDGDINTELVKSFKSYAHKGGVGFDNGTNRGFSLRPSAGGGGATEDGGDVYAPTTNNTIVTYRAGKGGEGLKLSITGTEIVYGSGGGGGITKYLDKNNKPVSGYDWVAGKGGTGAGNGVNQGNGGDATANQGGGGGGSAYGTGGDGGSGIVVFRYAYNFKVGDNFYFDFASAANNVAENDTIEILNNDETSGSLGKSITLEIKEGVSYTGKITLTDAAVQLTAAEGLNVITTVANSEVKFENGVYSVVASVFTVALPTVENATWSYNGMSVTGPIIVNKGTNVELTLSAADGYQFANGQTSVTVTFENVNDNIAADNSAFASITAPQKPAVAKIGEMKFGSVSSALDYAYNNNLKDVVITLLGETAANTTDSVDLYNKYENGRAFNNITFNQEDSFKPYYLNCLYTGWTTGKVVFDGVNIVVTSQLFAIGNFELINNSTIKRANDTKNFIFYGNMIINEGSIFESQVDGISSESSLTVDGGTYKTVFLTVESGNTFTVVNGANVLITNYEYSGDLTVNGVLNIDCDSTINAMRILGDGKIVVDATGKTEGDEISLTANLANFTGTLETVGNDDLEASIVDGKIVLVKKEVVLAGAGTEANPFLIKNIEDLVLFRDSVNAGETKYNAPGVYVELAADIDMAGVNWVGIGSVSQPHGFMGNFDGREFKIMNLTITNPALDSDGYAYAGLFGITEGTDANNQNVIKNLTIENVTISTTGHIVSAAIAYPYYTIVENVKVLGDINITGGNYTAGALAYTRRCVNASNVSVVGNPGSTITGGQAVGGVISDIQMNGGLIANYSNFKAENLTITGTKMVGGISGIIATQTLNGATVKDVTINCADRAGQVVGSFGGTSTISNIVVENVTGADAIIGGGYDGSKPVEAKLGDTFYSTFAEAYSKATAGDTITLLRDVILTSKLTLNKAVTVDGNGHSIVADSNIQWYTVSGKLNIKNYSPWVVVTAQGCELKNVVIDCNSCAGGVKIENADAVIFDTVSIIKSKADTLTVTGSLLIENYFKAEGSYSTIDARNGVVTVAEGTIFDMDKFSGNVSPAKCDLKAAVDTNGEPYFCAYGSTTYYRTLTSIVGTIKDLTLLDDVALEKDLSVSGTLNLNEKTLTLAEGKVLKTGGDLTIINEATFVGPIELTSASYTVTAPDCLNVITNVEGKKVGYENGVYKLADIVYAAQIGEQKYETLASALAAAQNDAVVELLWAEGNAPIAMNGSVYGKSVTITGTATVDWSKGFLFVGRGGEGNGTVVFDNANLASASNNASYGIHVSGREKNTNNKYDGTVVINNSTIVLDYLIDKGAMTMTNSTLTVKNGFAVGGRPASETESGVDATATFDLTNGSTLIVNNHNGMGLGYEAIGVMTIDSTSTFECTQSFLVTDKGVLKSAGNVFGDILKSANAQIELTGGIYTDEEVPGWCAEPYAALPNLNNQYVVGVKPTATVNSFGATTVPAGEYGVWNGSSYTGTSKVDMPLSFVMQFLADQNEEDMKTSPFADWYGDFVITFTGIENGSFTADGCYLAGHYGDFGWVKVPVDGMIIENDARYPVMLGVGLGQKYDYICSSVEDFKCAMFLTPEIIAANPNLKVKLELAVVDNSKGSDDAANALVNNDKVFSVTEYEYGAEAFAPALPTATVTSIDAPEGTPLTFALNFKADDVTDEQLAYYRDWYADFVLTITGLPEEGVTFNTDGTADGYLAGQYDAWSENWVSVPFEDVTLRDGESIKIMEYAATLMGQSGLKLTYNDVYSFVKNFDCGVYFTPEFLAANPDMKVSLSLRMYKTGDATDEGVAIGEMEEFSAPTVVAKIGSTPYATLEAAIVAAGADDTVTILKNVGTDAAIRVAKKVTIDLNGKTIAATENDKVGDGVFCVVASGDLTINDSVGTGVINGVGDNDYNIAIWANGGKVTINGGNYTNVGATDKTDSNAHFDLIYAKNGGEVIINGGTFECETPAFTLNSHDTYKGVITVNGGTFVGFDPRNNAAETAGTTFMAVGKYTFAEGGNYIVVTPEDYILNGAASDSATVGDVDSLLAGAVTVTKDGEKYVAIATYTFKVTAVDTVNPEKSSYELTGGKLRPGKTVAVKYIDLATGAESWVKPESDTVTFKLVIK